ncbi:MAG: hypothetical protein RR907_03640 [Comamonas sp.]
MVRVVYQPCSDPVARKNLQTTILNPVQLADIEDLLQPDLRQKLRSAYPDGHLFIWGLASPKTEQSWLEMEPGDVVVFNTKAAITVSACFTHRVKSRDLALRLWGWKDESQAVTWENIYFVDDVQHHALDFKVMQEQLSYERNRSFFRYDASYSDEIFRLYPELDRGFVSSSPSLEDARKEIQLQATEGTANVSTRLEHKYIVRHLFQGKKAGYCCICHKEYPRHLLVAAHIKKRSACSMKEKLDIENIALPMCRLGCDSLFELGYISAREGVVVPHPSQEVAVGLKNYIDSVVGNPVKGWSHKHRKYFAWHLDAHGFLPGDLACAQAQIVKAA